MSAKRAAFLLLFRRLFLPSLKLVVLAGILMGAAGAVVAQTPAARIDNLSQDEGNTGTTDFVFTVTLNLEPTVAASVDWATANGSATAPDDYAASSGTLNFAVGQATATLTVPVVADRVYEATESFYVNLSNPVNCTIQDGTASGWVTNDDVRVSIAALIQDEGQTGTSDFVFTVTLSGTYEFPVSVNWATADGSAIAPDDYTASSGTVDFPVGETTATLTVPVVGDRVYEQQEYFSVILSDPVNCTIQTGSAYGWITNDDVRVAIADLIQDEGNTGTTDYVFMLTLSGEYDVPVSVDWATADGNAVAPADYATSSGTVNFPAGETTATLIVPVVADRDYEPQEYFRVVLSNPVDCSIHDGTAYGWITNDDVRVAIADLIQDEGNTGTTDFVFTVTLSGSYEFPVSVDWATADGNAVAPDDYSASSGTVNFPVGETAATLTVPVVADRDHEPQEYFYVHLSNPVNCTIQNDTGYGLIDNDDVRVVIGHLTQDEGDAGTTDFVFTVTLSGTYEFPVSVDWMTSDGSAISPDDYAASSGTVNIPIGETEGTLTVPIVGDLYRETNEYFTVHLSNPVNCSLGNSSANGTIQNDDEYPAISVGDVSAGEGHTGTTAFQFSVTLSADYVEVVRVYYHTADGSAVEPDDYEHVTGQLTFPIGETEVFTTVNVVGDYEVEPDEAFEVILYSASNGSIGDGTGVGTIENDDLGVALSIGDAADWEGDSGTTELQFDVTLAEASLTTVSVDWTTVDGTAFAGEDYIAAFGTLTFPAGETLRTVLVSVLGDLLDECTEEFYVELSNPVNATVFVGQGIGTIQHDDLADCVNADGDCYHDEACGGRDCDDSDPSVYPKAPESNDGIDNQCPGDHGYGVIDEISGVCDFHDGDTVRFSWPEQAGADTYEVARSPQRDFLTICVLWPPTSMPYVDDVSDPSIGECFYYLVRAATPNPGSWGENSQDIERTFTCPNP